MFVSGFAKLIDLLLEVWESLLPWVIIDSFEQAVVLRLGGGPKRSSKNHPYARVIGPTDGVFGTGFHWMWPFVEHALSSNVVPALDNYPNQVFRSKDGTSYLTFVHLLWRIDDIVTFTLDVESASDVLSDAAAGITRRVIAQMTDEELQDERLETELTQRVRARTKRFGVYVEQVYVSELAPTGLKDGVLRVETGEVK